MAAYPSPERLESRIAPATFISAREVRYSEGDGDLVSVQISRPIFHDDLREFSFVADGAGERLQSLLLDKTAQGASLTITAEPMGAGSGQATVREIQASADLLKVAVDGTLGRISVGDARLSNQALGLLAVDSLGGVSNASAESEIRGPAGEIRIAGDVSEASIHVGGSLSGFFVGGSLRGGAADSSGTLRVDGILKRVEVGDSVIGGAGLESGSILAGQLSSVQVHGDVIGGSGDGSGQLLGGKIGNVKIGGNLQGGSALPDAAAPHHGSGLVIGERRVGRVYVAGSIIGSSGFGSGAVLSGGALLLVIAQEDLRGGDGQRSGIIRAQGNLSVVKINGSVIGSAGSESASIRAGEVLDAPGSFYERSIFQLRIDGDLRGGDGDLSGFVEAPRTLVSFDIGGSILGSAARGGIIGATHLGSGHVGGDVRGGDVPVGRGSSGTIGGETAKLLVIEGSLVGSTDFSGSVGFNRIGSLIIGGDASGLISGGLRLNSLEIGGSLIGNDQPVSARVDAASVGTVHIHGSIRNVRTTYVENGSALVAGGFYVGRLGSLIVDGGIFASDLGDRQPAITSYAVLASGRVGVVKVGGVLAGTASNHLGLAAGALEVGRGFYGNEPAATAAGFGSIEIGGSVRFAEINAGTAQTERFGTSTFIGNPDARIGSIIAHGSWMASTITVGAQPGPDGQYGTNDDSPPLPTNGVDGSALSQIGRVIIVGHVTGTSAASDQFAIQAQRIGSASINGVRLPLTAGLDRFELARATADIVLRELGG